MRPMTRDRRFTFGFDRFSGLYLWALFILFFGLVEPHTFLTVATLHSIAASQAVVAILAIALIIPLTTGTYDLSVGATANLTAILVVELQNHGVGLGLSIFVSLAAGVAIGAVNGFVTVRLGVSSFITTLGMATIVGAVQTIVSGQLQPLPPTSRTWGALTQNSVAGFQVVVLYLIAIAAVTWWILQQTPAGRFMFASGANPEAARLSGVRVNKWVWISLISSSLIAGIGGVLFSSYSGPSLTFGPGLLLPAFAAAFLGSTQITPGRFNVVGTVLAVYILQTGVRGMQLLSQFAWVNDMFNGVALIVAVAFAAWRQRRAKALRATGPTPNSVSGHDSDRPSPATGPRQGSVVGLDRDDGDAASSIGTS